MIETSLSKAAKNLVKKQHFEPAKMLGKTGLRRSTTMATITNSKSFKWQLGLGTAEELRGWQKSAHSCIRWLPKKMVNRRGKLLHRSLQWPRNFGSQWLDFADTVNREVGWHCTKKYQLADCQGYVLDSLFVNKHKLEIWPFLMFNESLL